MAEPTHVHVFDGGGSVGGGGGSVGGGGGGGGGGGAAGGGGRGSRAPLVLLHGTDGRETDLLGLAAAIAPGAVTLGVRGTVVTEEGFAFFRRLPDRSLDEADLVARVPVLAAYVEAACAEHQLDERPVVVGYSNGAIMAAALLVSCPDLFGGAVLLRPLPPFAADLPQRLDGTPVLVVEGRDDPRRSHGDGRRVARRLRAVGADVTCRVLPVGHAVTDEDVRLARRWLGRRFGAL